MFEAIEALIEALASEGWTATDTEILSEIKVIESDAFDREILSTREKCTR